MIRPPKQPKVLPFTVEGSGEFPTDMLRYDVCQFSTPQDEVVAGKGYRDENFTGSRRRVTLLSTSLNLYNKPTTRRWASFGWSVVQVGTPITLDAYRDLVALDRNWAETDHPFLSRFQQT